MVRSREEQGASRKDLYLIGEVSRIGGISQRALRHYDELGLIEPDRVGENNYRYYSHRTMLKIPVINYFKKMGFSLEEIVEVSQSTSLRPITEMLGERAAACERDLRDVNERCEIIRAWSSLISEAGYIVGIRPAEVNCRFLPAQTFLSMPYRFWGDYADATINLEFTAHVSACDNVIAGAVHMRHPCYRKRLQPLAEGEEHEVTIFQRALRPIAPEHRFERPEGMYLSAFHVGPFEELAEAYERIIAYADERGYRLSGCAYERFVTDYWTTYDPTMFVTEVLMPIER